MEEIHLEHNKKINTYYVCLKVYEIGSINNSFCALT